MHHLLRAAWLVTGLGLVAGGCSSKGGDDGGSAAPIAEADLPAQFAKVYCTSIAPCCNAGHVAFDATACESQVGGAATFLVGAKAGQTYDAAAAGKCVAELGSALKSCDPYAGSASTPDCYKLVIGSTPAGGACTIDRDCAAPNDCAYINGANVGVCDAPHRYAALGEACDIVDNECGAGTWCNAGVCVAVTDSGPCENTGGCTEKTYCAAGQCAPRQANGAVCRDDYECAAGRCIGGEIDDTPNPDGNGLCGKATVATVRNCSGASQ